MTVQPSQRTLPAQQQSIHPGLLFFVSRQHKQHVKQLTESLPPPLPSASSNQLYAPGNPECDLWDFTELYGGKQQRVLDKTQLSAVLIITFRTNMKTNGDVISTCINIQKVSGSAWGCKGMGDI